MKTIKRIAHVTLWTSLFWSATGFCVPERSHAGVDHSLFGELLEKYVKNGTVDYQGFKNHAAILDRYLKVLEGTDTQRLSRNEKFAFYINAYNAWTIKLILTGYPGIESIKDLGNVFKTPWAKPIVRVDGDILTLDQIEHEILRPVFRDPRVHFAINCAAKGCPPLHQEPYRGEILDQQVDEMTRTFINDSRYNRFEDKTLFVSRIFKWFSEDFHDDVVGFFIQYTQGNLKKQLEKNRNAIRIKHLDYDWTLNGK